MNKAHMTWGGLPMIYVDISTQYFDCGELYHGGTPGPHASNRFVLCKCICLIVESN